MNIFNIFKKETIEQKVIRAEKLSKELEDLFLEYKSNSIIYEKEIIFLKKELKETNDMLEILKLEDKIHKIKHEDLNKCFGWKEDKKLKKIEKQLEKIGICKIKAKFYYRSKESGYWHGNNDYYYKLSSILETSYGRIVWKQY